MISSEAFLHNKYSDAYSSMDHFWLDLRRVPLKVVLREKMSFSTTIASQLGEIGPIHDLHIWCPVNNDALRHMNGLNDGCKVYFFSISEVGLEQLKKELPNVEITAEIIDQ